MRRRISLKFLCVVLVLCITYFCLFWGPEQADKQESIKLIERSIRSPLNMGPCIQPHLAVKEPSVMRFFQDAAPVNCGPGLSEWVTCEMSKCFVKPQILSAQDDVVCSYTDLIRKSDYRIRYGKTTKTSDPYLLQESDFVKVVCTAKSGDRSISVLAGMRDKVSTGIPYGMPIRPTVIFSPTGQELETMTPYYNVLIMGFDSISRNSFIRSMPQTYRYLVYKMDAVVLKGYNILGDGTPQALIPLLTGYTELELPETRRRMRGAMHVNVYPFIWNEYKRAGYMTSFNEDIPRVGTFTYRLRGFDEQPVDHYLRTFYMEAETQLNSKMYCVGNTPSHRAMLRYTNHFMGKYAHLPRFVFSFHGGLSHDSTYMIGSADSDVTNWLVDMQDRRRLDDTILIMMSDHGSRYSEVRKTLQGKQEERLPFFSFAFPKTFQQRFPRQYTNFLQNANHLTTPFDIHATLQHLLKLQVTNLILPPNMTKFLNEFMEQKKKDDAPTVTLSPLAQKRAISLFDEVPANRSCADAYIEPHWCACLLWESLNPNSTDYQGLSLRLAVQIITTINEVTNRERNLCAELELREVNWVMRQKPHEDMVKYKGSKDLDGYRSDLTGDPVPFDDLYQLQIVTDPGASLFEASVTYNSQTFKATVKLSDISRINQYGKQADCIYELDPELRKYCYCRTTV